MFSKNAQISNFMKIPPVGAESSHANQRTDEQTDVKLLIHNFAKASKERKGFDDCVVEAAR